MDVEPGDCFAHRNFSSFHGERRAWTVSCLINLPSAMQPMQWRRYGLGHARANRGVQSAARICMLNTLQSQKLGVATGGRTLNYRGPAPGPTAASPLGPCDKQLTDFTAWGNPTEWRWCHCTGEADSPVQDAIIYWLRYDFIDLQSYN
jgi:hypothetical protein